MPTTSGYGLRYPALADPPDIPQIVKNLADDVETAIKPPVAQLYQATAQALSNNTFTAITFGGESIDSHGAHSNTTNPSRWTCPAGWAGYYLVSGMVYLDDVTGPICVAIRKNGSVVKGSLTRTAAAGSSAADSGATSSPVLVQLAVGDYLELWAEQNSGSTKNTYATGDFTSGLTVTFVRKV